MDEQKTYESWLNQALKDLDEAENIFVVLGYREIVVYLCQQATEKLVKAIYFRLVDRDIPFSHNIEFIVRKFESRLTNSVDKNLYTFFSQLSRFYINGRYPDEDGDIIVQVDKDETEKLLCHTKEAFQWLLNSMPQPDPTPENQTNPDYQSKSSPKP
jgi:HEPN domain-containing protein